METPTGSIPQGRMIAQGTFHRSTSGGAAYEEQFVATESGDKSGVNLDVTVWPEGQDADAKLRTGPISRSFVTLPHDAMKELMDGYQTLQPAGSHSA